MSKKSKQTRKAKRRLPKDLEAPTPEGHKLAKDAMAPYLAEFQAAADEQTKKDFGVDVDAPPAKKVVCPVCCGTGEGVYNESCSRCAGSGYIPEQK